MQPTALNEAPPLIVLLFIPSAFWMCSCDRDNLETGSDHGPTYANTPADGLYDIVFMPFFKMTVLLMSL